LKGKSTAEQKSARKKSPVVEEMYQIYLQTRTKTDLTIRDVIAQFKHELVRHSTHDTTGYAFKHGASTKFNSPSPLIRPIKDKFLQFIESLPEDQKTTLMALRKDRGSTFADIMNELRPSSEQCIYVISNMLGTFLDNPANAEFLGADIYRHQVDTLEKRYTEDLDSLRVEVDPASIEGFATLTIPKHLKAYFLILETLKKLIRFIIRLFRLLGRILTILNMLRLLAVGSIVGNIALSIYTIILIILTPVSAGWILLGPLLVLQLLLCLISIVVTSDAFHDVRNLASINLSLFLNGLSLLLYFIISKVANIVWMLLTKLIVSGFGMLGLSLTSIGLPIFTGIISGAVILALLNASFARTSFQKLIYVISNIFLTLCSSAAIVTSYITAGVALKVFLLIMSAPTVVATATMITLIASASLLMCGAAVLSSVVVFVDMLSPLDQRNMAVRFVISVCNAINIMGLFTGPFALAALFEQGTALFITLGQLILGSSTALQLSTFSVFAVGYAVPCLAAIALGFAGKKLLDSYAPDALPSVQRHVGQAWNAVADTAGAVVSGVGYQVRRFVRGY
jgi:hypothetical protein